jgi:hypothetical protein
MCRYNSKAKVPLKKEETPKSMKDKNEKQEVPNGRGRVKEEPKEDEYG